MSSLKPIVVYGDYMTPNPAKIRIILEELKLPFEVEHVSFGEAKSEAYVKINPNGRLPAIHDPNTGVTLWESAAISTYLVDQYDKAHTLSFDTLPEKYLIQQWIAFQVSGQGPYYGQGVWFSFIHPEKLPSAIERYDKEIERVRSVIDGHLKKVSETSSPSSSGPWLVGDKCTVADLSWVMWEHVADFLLDRKGITFKGKYPHYETWIQKLFERPTCREAIAKRVEAMANSGISSSIRDDAKESIGESIKQQS